MVTGDVSVRRAAIPQELRNYANITFFALNIAEIPEPVRLRFRANEPMSPVPADCCQTLPTPESCATSTSSSCNRRADTAIGAQTLTSSSMPPVAMRRWSGCGAMLFTTSLSASCAQGRLRLDLELARLGSDAARGFVSYPHPQAFRFGSFLHDVNGGGRAK